MAATYFIARTAENAVGGAFSGMAPGGRLTYCANTMQIATNKNAIASRSIVRCFIAGKICCRYKLSTLTCSPMDEPAVVGRVWSYLVRIGLNAASQPVHPRSLG